MGKKLSISTNEARQILRKLSKHYRIRMPKLSRETEIPLRSHYAWHSNTIHLNYLANLDTVLHEFAHALCCNRGGYREHDKRYWLSLLDVVSHWFGDYRKYGWKYEYAAGQNFFDKIKRR